MYKHIHMHVIETKANEAINVKMSTEAYMAGLGRKTGKGEMMQLHYNFTN